MVGVAAATAFIHGRPANSVSAVSGPLNWRALGSIDLGQVHHLSALQHWPHPVDYCACNRPWLATNSAEI